MSKPPDWWPLNPFHKSYWVQGELFYTGQDSYAAWQEGAYAMKLAIVERMESNLFLNIEGTMGSNDSAVVSLLDWEDFKRELGLPPRNWRNFLMRGKFDRALEEELDRGLDIEARLHKAEAACAEKDIALKAVEYSQGNANCRCPLCGVQRYRIYRDGVWTVRAETHFADCKIGRALSNEAGQGWHSPEEWARLVNLTLATGRDEDLV